MLSKCQCIFIPTLSLRLRFPCSYEFSSIAYKTHLHRLSQQIMLTFYNDYIWCVLCVCVLYNPENFQHGKQVKKGARQSKRVLCFCARLLKVLGMGWVQFVRFELCFCILRLCVLCSLLFLSNQVGEFNQLIRTELIRRCVLALYSASGQRGKSEERISPFVHYDFRVSFAIVAFYFQALRVFFSLHCSTFVEFCSGFISSKDIICTLNGGVGSDDSKRIGNAVCLPLLVNAVQCFLSLRLLLALILTRIVLIECNLFFSWFMSYTKSTLQILLKAVCI